MKNSLISRYQELSRKHLWAGIMERPWESTGYLIEMCRIRDIFMKRYGQNIH